MGMDSSQCEAFYHGAQKAHDQWGKDQACPEAKMQGNGIGEIGAQHIETGVGKIKYPHHTEDEREPAGQHEQEQPRDEAIQGRKNEDFQHCLKAMILF